MRVEIYWNIREKEYSVRALSGPNKGRVIKRGHNFNLSNCTLVVQKAGREKVLRERCKNVHAFIRGTLTSNSVDSNKFSRVRYNPYREAQWQKDGQPVFKSSFVNLTTNEDGNAIVLALV
jgi:hypothetical protein